MQGSFTAMLYSFLAPLSVLYQEWEKGTWRNLSCCFFVFPAAGFRHKQNSLFPKAPAVAPRPASPIVRHLGKAEFSTVAEKIEMSMKQLPWWPLPTATDLSVFLPVFLGLLLPLLPLNRISSSCPSLPPSLPSSAGCSRAECSLPLNHSFLS